MQTSDRPAGVEIGARPNQVCQGANKQIKNSLEQPTDRAPATNHYALGSLSHFLSLGQELTEWVYLYIRTCSVVQVQFPFNPILSFPGAPVTYLSTGSWCLSATEHPNRTNESSLRSLPTRRQHLSARPSTTPHPCPASSTCIDGHIQIRYYYI